MTFPIVKESVTGSFAIRDIQRHEHDALGQLMVRVYSALSGFPTPEEQRR